MGHLGILHNYPHDDSGRNPQLKFLKYEMGLSSGEVGAQYRRREGVREDHLSGRGQAGGHDWTQILGRLGGVLRQVIPPTPSTQEQTEQGRDKLADTS